MAQRRHLQVVTSGVSWEANDPDRECGGEEPLQPSRVVPARHPTSAITPSRAALADATERIRETLAAAHTYALLAWRQWWELVVDHVMDPALRDEVADAAERELDQRRAAAARRLRRARTEEDQAAARRELDRLERRVVSEVEIDMRTLAARTGRLARRLAVPACVLVGPAVLVYTGAWVGVLVWPAAWCWLAVQGRALAAARPELLHRAETRPSLEPRTTPTPASSAATATTVVGASVAENRILARLGEWDRYAAQRGLAGVAVADCTLGDTGITVVLHTSGKLTPAQLVRRVDVVRAVLAVPARVAMDITPGDVGDQAVLRIRTRRLELDTVWRPGRTGIGLDTDTGEVVEVPDDARMVVCGASGAGKSWALRSYMARIVLSDYHHLVYIDGKGEEAGIWRGKCRVAVGGDEIRQVVAELCEEMERRYRDMEARGITVWDGPRIAVVVDEGRVVLGMRDRELTQRLIDLSALGRSRGIVLRWCTQYPTTSGDAPGIHPQIKINVDALFCLRVKSSEHARVALDEDADYGPQSIGLDQAGAGYLGGYGPTLVQTWLVDDDAVKALPDRTPWQHGAPAEGDSGEAGGDWIGAQAAVVQALRDAGGQASTAELEEATGYSRSAVKSALAELRDAGRVAKGPGHRDPWRLL